METYPLCHFCENNYLIPRNNLDIYIKKNIKSNTKLILLSRISEDAKNYLFQNFPEIFNKINLYTIDSNLIYSKYFLIKQFLYYDKSTHISSFTECDICKYNACMFHLINGNFFNYKCIKCFNHTSICGWCQEKFSYKNFCNKCISINYFIFL